MFGYLALGTFIAALIHLSLTFFTSAKPVTIRKTARILLIAIIVAVIFFLLRFGLVHMAAIVSFISVAVPLIVRLRNAKVEWDSASRRKTGQQTGQPRGQGQMSEATAREILGLEMGADEKTIRAAHKRMIRKNHPDHGGTKFLASQINEARDVLLEAHRKTNDKG